MTAELIFIDTELTDCELIFIGMVFEDGDNTSSMLAGNSVP
jgi:hypothetical protein